MQSLHCEKFLMRFLTLLSLFLLPHSLLAISCNFESSPCEWENETDSLWWLFGSGNGSNSSTPGPMYDHTITHGGWYLFVSPASTGGNNTAARLVSINQTATACDLCFSFWYHMYGPSIGYLNLKARQEGQPEQLLWTRTATQGNEWRRAFHTISPQLKHFQLIFEASLTEEAADIAIDDISVVGGACEPQHMCNFEADCCEFTFTGLQTWQRERGGSPNSTDRPTSDITKETEQGYYMLANTSQQMLPSGQALVLVSPPHAPRDIVCLQFWVQANVRNSGILNVYVEEDSLGKRLIWSNVVAPLKTWRLGRANIQTDHTWKLVFEAVGGGADLSYIAIDDVMLLHTQCPRMGVCNFEKGMCGWRNVLDPKKDHVDWNWNSGKAPNHFQVPTVDHTLGTKEGHYMFVDIGAINVRKDAWLLSEHLPPTKGSCLMFHYRSNINKHLMHGPLKVFQYTPNGMEKMLWEAKDIQDDNWRTGNITVENAMEFQIGFKAIKSEELTNGYIAIDDIEYHPGVNCFGVPTDSAAGGASNTAGIVAAVILILAALVCLAVATNYWYKNKIACFRGSSNDSRTFFGFDNISYRNRNKNTVPVETVPASGVQDPQ
ncbi:apical endosomal glycoprotein-like isoform X1 [Hypanus sabinus]|uniref:apical endosomal glycoprotein-like isoform X1 n=1 Tax=Hypanus sabinus TaxID=79690 RepID=UPI0028C4A901|nr:apical endosomal glycoprotein-like isoform X1 [Hypanus sabinus]